MVLGVRPMSSSPLKNKDGLTEAEFLAAYDPSKYDRPSVTADTLLFTLADGGEMPGKCLQLLLIKRGDHPFIGQWALPGGFVNMDEDLEEAALRELQEETGVTPVYMEQLYTWGKVGRDPRTRVITVSYLALGDQSCREAEAVDDADDAAWFTVDCRPLDGGEKGVAQASSNEREYRLTLTCGERRLWAMLRTVREPSGPVRPEPEILQSSGLAFDHAKIIFEGIRRLRQKGILNGWGLDDIDVE